MKPPEFFPYRDGVLCCEDLPVREIVQQVGTPCYIYSETAVRIAFRRFKAAFSQLDPLICYAVKANSNLAILRILADEGAGFDVVSAGELSRLRKAGVDSARVVFSGVGKSRPEFQAALDDSIFSIQMESVDELEAWSAFTREIGRGLSISLRFNPDVGASTHPHISTGQQQHKFGISMDQVSRIVEIVRGNSLVRATGVGSHIGSQILEVEPFIESFRRLKRLADALRRQGIPIEHLDLGGGIGVPYRDEESFDFESYASILEAERGDYRVVFEPGRSIVAEAGALLTRVIYNKQVGGKRFVIVDAAMTDLLRPSLYDAYHEIIPERWAVSSVKADIVGPVCESGDFLGKNRDLPDVRPGSLLAAMNVGAYGFCLASNYNARPRAAEVIVRRGEFRIARKRETFDDLVRGEGSGLESSVES